METTSPYRRIPEGVDPLCPESIDRHLRSAEADEAQFVAYMGRLPFSPSAVWRLACYRQRGYLSDGLLKQLDDEALAAYTARHPGHYNCPLSYWLVASHYSRRTQ